MTQTTTTVIRKYIRFFVYMTVFFATVFFTSSILGRHSSEYTNLTPPAYADIPHSCTPGDGGDGDGDGDDCG